ncbi:MAG: M4 family metallopeptidase [Myxococcales bacterium]|nr:M4 family metallopeptidase [Myxococcales bacterium]
MKFFFLSLLLCLLFCPGCADEADNGRDGEDSTDDDSYTPADDDDDNDDAPGTDKAKVFEINPVLTDQIMKTTLEDVADDAGGALISRIDDEGIRKLRVLTCSDEEETIDLPGLGTQRICTLRPLANKNENGDFVYPDWPTAVAGVYDPNDVHAEVELYYHAQKIYRFITGENVGVFTHLPGRHKVNGEATPINLVANYRLPTTTGNLEPISTAFYSPHEYMQQGMAEVNGLLGYEGDFLVFGQGSHADFAYDGETIYHEFGHLINYATAGLEYNIYADEYGLCNLTNALNEGLADTFSWLVSGNPTALFAYLEQTAGPGFSRDVDNDLAFPRDLRGFDPTDGGIIAGANFAVYQQLAAEPGLSPEVFTRLILLTLLELPQSEEPDSFAKYADTFLAILESEGLSEAAPAIREIFTARGLYETVRAKEITDYREADHQLLIVGGTYDAPWNVSMDLRIEDAVLAAAPAYVQGIVDLPSGASTLVITATLLSAPDAPMYPDPTDWDLRLYLRRVEPIRYVEQTDGTFQVTYDQAVAAEAEKRDRKTENTWRAEGLTAGNRYYLQFVNFGEASATLMNLDIAAQ